MIRKRGSDMSSNITTIMDFFDKNREGSYTAYDLSDYLTKKKIHMHLATIYRNLDRLTKEEKIIKYKASKDESFRYQWAKPDKKCHEHLHMRCRICDKIFHLECDYMHELTKHLLEHHGFILECDDSVLLGICKDCGEKYNEKK